MTKLCPRGKAAAKRKFRVYPSAYANAYASKICAGKIKDPSGVKRKDWGPKKAKVGMAVTAGSQSGMGRLQKSGLQKAKKGKMIIMIAIGKPKKVKKAKEGRMFTAAQVRALDESTGPKANPKKKERIMESGDKDKIKLSKTNLKKFSTGMSYKDMEPYGGKYAKIKSDMRAKASENVKRLTTQPSAYDPETRYIVGSQRKGNARRVMIRKTTDQVNLKEAANKLKGDMGSGARVSVLNEGQAMRNRVIKRPKIKFSKGAIMKVANKLEKASKAHAGQAKTLKSIKLSRGGGAAIRGTNFTGVF